MSEALDDEIAQLKAEIQGLKEKRKLLTSSLLSSTKVQSQLSNLPAAEDETTTPLDLANIQDKSQSNAHRLAFGVTAFPFEDPSPELQSKNPLLGIRFDICDRNGKFKSPYYIFCVRAHDTGQILRLHRHTLPALVPLEQYEREHLPLQTLRAEDDEGYAGSDDSRAADIREVNNQDLHALVARVRYDLVSWHLRQDAISWLQEELDPNLTVSKDNPREKAVAGDDDSHNPDPHDTSELEVPEPSPMKFNISSLSSVQVDARQIRIIWSDDRVGRLKIADAGAIEKAVVFGEDNHRLGGVERLLMGDGTERVHIKDLLGRLEKVHQKNFAAVYKHEQVRQDDDHEASQESDPEDGPVGEQENAREPRGRGRPRKKMKQ